MQHECGFCTLDFSKRSTLKKEGMKARCGWLLRGPLQALRLLGERGRKRNGCTPGNLCAELANDAQKNSAQDVTAETKTAPLREPSEKLVASRGIEPRTRGF
jgi:hypothetical protein